MYQEVIKVIYLYNELRKKYKSNNKIKQLLLENEIFKIEKGLYSDNKNVNYLEVLSKKYPNAIFTMDSAFYHYQLTDVIPERYYLATDRNAAKISDKRIVQIFEQGDLLMLGVDTVVRDGQPINVYSKERLLVELLRHKSKLPFDYYKEIIQSYRDIVYDLDIRAIQDYAYAVPKSAKILETLQLEVL